MKNGQRVWFVSELYYPEMTSTGRFLTGIAEGLSSRYEISALCGQPSYWARGVHAPTHELFHGVDIHRCWATTLDKSKLYFRAVNLLTISMSIVWKALFRFRRRDIAIVVTNPPLLPYLLALVCRLKHARFVLLIHDVYPEVLIRTGMLKLHSLPARLLDSLSCRLYNSADRIVVLGRDMESLAARKLKSCRERVIIAPNWGDTETIRPRALSGNSLLDTLKLRGKFVVQYCGNIGRTHGIEDLVGAAEMLRGEPEIEFLLIGWGAKKNWAVQQRQARDLPNLTILDPLAEKDLCDGLNACNISIISLSGGMAGISVPSRMYNILASGKPVLAVCDDESEMAAVVREEEIGWVVPPGRPDLIVSTLHEAISAPALLCRMGQRARQAAETKYTVGHVLEIYESLIEGMRGD